MHQVIIALAFALVVAVFAIQNASVVPVRFLGWAWEASLVYVILGSAAMGALFVAVLGAYRQVSLALRVRDCQGRLKKVEAELDSCKDMEKRLTEESARLNEDRQKLADECASLKRDKERLEKALLHSQPGRTEHGSGE